MSIGKKKQKKEVRQIKKEVEELFNSPEERKKNEEFVKKVTYLSLESLMRKFNV